MATNTIFTLLSTGGDSYLQLKRQTAMRLLQVLSLLIFLTVNQATAQTTDPFCGTTGGANAVGRLEHVRDGQVVHNGKIILFK